MTSPVARMSGLSRVVARIDSNVRVKMREHAQHVTSNT